MMMMMMRREPPHHQKVKIAICFIVRCALDREQVNITEYVHWSVEINERNVHARGRKMGNPAYSMRLPFDGLN